MTPIDSTSLECLRAALSPSATVNLPSDIGYSNSRWALNAEKHAAVVACPVTPTDVAHILAFAQGRGPYDTQHPLPIVVKV